MKKKLLFIVGSDRSGSTLLDRLLGRLDGVFSGGELWHFFLRGVIENDLCGCGDQFRDCHFWAEVVNRQRTGQGLLSPTALEDIRRGNVRMRNVNLFFQSEKKRSPETEKIGYYRNAFSALYDAIFDVAKCNVIVDSSKNPAHAYVLKDLPRYDVRIVHLVRDSRGVAYSWSKKKVRPEVTKRVEYMDSHGSLRSALLWSASNLLSDYLQVSARGSFVRIRYEDLTRDPSSCLGDIGRLLGDSAVPDVIGKSVELKSSHNLSGNPMRMKSGATELREDARWKTDMRWWHKALVSAFTAPLLARYGYKIW